ncbi:hypothetical protein F5Y17DRAFT_11951 [Xylariaceae sp. FL0594]|nr:hypothetical protein F5Y17DRAFT_11951 [Xylariaceae sp. FL0594]
MSLFERTSSPVLTMASSVPQGAFGMSPFSHQSSPFGRMHSWASAPRRSLDAGGASSTAGRKRSREEASVNIDIEETRAINQQTRSSLQRNKSQRLDPNAAALPQAEVQANGVSITRDSQLSALTPGLSADVSSQPIVDNFTLHLGIGWRRISEDEHIQAASRGWARYIENHYPVTNVRIQSESKSLQSYLIEANEGFFLFSENLRHGQFVSKDVDQALANLRCSPPVFEGQAVMTAADSPRPIDMPAQQAPVVVDIDMN